jgi:hypothetical protein
MAKKAKHGEKSQAIRDYFKHNPKAKAPEVVAALAEKGIKVSTPMVYTLKARNTMGKKRKQARSAGAEISLSISRLIAAKKFADQAGGIDQAREALDALAKLQ